MIFVCHIVTAICIKKNKAVTTFIIFFRKNNLCDAASLLLNMLSFFGATPPQPSPYQGRGSDIRTILTPPPAKGEVGGGCFKDHSTKHQSTKNQLTLLNQSARSIEIF